MVGANVKVICDKAKIRKKLMTHFEKKAIPAVAEQALADCNEYVKVDSGMLKNSSEAASKIDKGILIWNTPYAKRQYYTGTPSHEKNPNASLQWCEVAKRKHLKDWQEVAQKAFDGD